MSKNKIRASQRPADSRSRDARPSSQEVRCQGLGCPWCCLQVPHGCRHEVAEEAAQTALSDLSTRPGSQWISLMKVAAYGAIASEFYSEEMVYELVKAMQPLQPRYNIFHDANLGTSGSSASSGRPAVTPSTAPPPPPPLPALEDSSQRQVVPHATTSSCSSTTRRNQLDRGTC